MNPGDKVKVKAYAEGGKAAGAGNRKKVWRVATVIKVYRKFALVDLGPYKENFYFDEMKVAENI